METNLSAPQSVPAPKGRIASIDAFRGFTILAMIFVIQVAGYKNLPFTMSWFGSPVVSTFHHAADAEGSLTGIGLTFTDLVAPFFVFVVGMVLPLSKRKRGKEWWKHVGTRTIMLIALGVIYISLIFGISYWWGILQAIGVAYFMGAVSILIPKWQRWILVFIIAGFHLFMSNTFNWWLYLGDPSASFFTIANLSGDPLRPLTIHCTPWASISYGLITIVGTILGEAVLTKNQSTIIKQSVLFFLVFCVVGYVLHLYDWPNFAMNKETVSASYSLFTSGVSALTFLIFYLIIDVWKFQKWAWALIIFGSNALLGYFLQPIVRIFLYALGFKQYLTGHEGMMGVLVGLIWTGLLWYIVFHFNKRNIFLKI